MKKTVKNYYKSILTKKALALLMLLSIGSTSFGQQSQSQILTIPPNSIKYNSSTPFTPGVSNLPIGDYNGGTTTNPSNCWYDESGNIMFFIVDGNVYDGSGLLIGQLRTPVDKAVILGTTELVVIPVPGHCKQFYLVSGYYNINHSSCVNGGWPQPYYAVLDMNVAHPTFALEGDMSFNSNAQGSFTTPTANLIVGNIGDVHNGTLHFAVTPLRLSTSDRLLFVSISNVIIVYTVTSSGIVASGNSNVFYSNVINGTDGSTSERNELEVVLLSNNTYRLAASYTDPLATPAAANTIYISDFSLSGAQISGTVHTFGLSPVYSVTPVVKGLEFSPNGQYLYITHHVYPYMQYINVGVSGLIPISLTGNAIDFQDTQIEMGYDGKMYFYGNNGSGNKRLATLSNPNSGFVMSNWVDPGSGNMYNVNVPLGTGCDPLNTDVNHALYLLPDQIDGEVYSKLYNSVNVTPNPTTICAGSCANLAYTSTNNDPVQVSYYFNHFWHYPPVYPAGPGNFGNWCPAASQVYFATPVVPAGSGYCVVSTEITINVTTNIPSFSLADNPNCSYTSISALANNAATTSSAGYGYMYIMEELNSSGSQVWIESQNPPSWWTFPSPTQFNELNNVPPAPDYVGSVNINTNPGSYPIGQFKLGNTYRITLGSWNNGCVWAQSSQTVTPGVPSGCREADPNGQTKSLIGNDYSAPDFSYLLNNQNTATDINNVNSNLNASFLTIYPNPNNGMFSIESDNYASGTPIEINDMMGRKVWSQTFENLKHQEIDMSSFENGIYFVKIKGVNSYSIKKIIKE
jgi:hypothetical protein